MVRTVSIVFEPYGSHKKNARNTAVRLFRGSMVHCYPIIRGYAFDFCNGELMMCKRAIWHTDKIITFNVSNEIEYEIWGYVVSQLGKKYDYWAIFASEIMSTGGHDPKRLYCSELCAEILNFAGLYNGKLRVAPQPLYEAITPQRIAI